MVEVAMDAPGGLAEVQVGLQERAVGLIGFPGLDDEFGNRMAAAIQEALGEAGKAVLGLGVGDGQAVEGNGDALGRPDVHTGARKILYVGVKFFLLGLELADQALALGAVEAHTAQGHVDEHRQDAGLELKDGLDLLVPQPAAQVLPELQGQRSILLGILAHVHGRELPELLFGMHAEVGRGLLEALLGLDFLEVVKT